MNKLTICFSFALCLSGLTLVGCGGAESTVIDTSSVNTPDTEVPVAGMSEEDYAKEMEKAQQN